MTVGYDNEAREVDRHGGEVVACNALLDLLVTHHAFDAPDFLLRQYRPAPTPALAPSPPVPFIPPPTSECDPPPALRPRSFIDPLVTLTHAVALHAKFPVAAIIGPNASRRTQQLCRARHILMYLSGELTHRSIAEIGRRLGRDHTTVLHGISKIKRLLNAGDAKLAADVAAIRLIASGADPRLGVAA